MPAIASEAFAAFDRKLSALRCLRKAFACLAKDPTRSARYHALAVRMNRVPCTHPLAMARGE